MRLLAQGAEAKIYKDANSILKSRAKKSYRLPALDDKLRSFRTRREAKILDKLAAIDFPAPHLISSTDTSMQIRMEYLPGDKLRDVLNKSNARRYGKEIGTLVAALHSNGIVHGDLTTSNMIVGKRLHFVDFGLSFFSQKAEDFAVDLHLFRQAVESYHNGIWNTCYPATIAAYKKSMQHADSVLSRLEKVELRGRYKGH